MASGNARTSVIFISEIAEPELLPSGAYSRLVLRGRAHGRREVLAAPLLAALELPRAGRVDQDAVPEPGSELRHVAVLERRARVDRRAENARENDDAVAAGVHAVGEGPVHLLVRGRIDVLLDNGDVLVAELGGAGAPQGGGDLLGLSLIGLLDLDHDVHAVRDRRDEDVTHPGNAGVCQDVPRDRRALD